MLCGLVLCCGCVTLWSPPQPLLCYTVMCGVALCCNLEHSNLLSVLECYPMLLALSFVARLAALCCFALCYAMLYYAVPCFVVCSATQGCVLLAAAAVLLFGVQFFVGVIGAVLLLHYELC